ncbi:hypothetical protein OIU79_006767 [Salix purpurea]|uniref:Uncharacterized protein n=1 Tax=Salix purpurea TaxID=77065 RepID=A0A9Q0TWA4_SALPP|nr:hypothetical protein OIU79_006767 [Salix purpurea]
MLCCTRHGIYGCVKACFFFFSLRSMIAHREREGKHYVMFYKLLIAHHVFWGVIYKRMQICDCKVLDINIYGLSFPCLPSYHKHCSTFGF